MIQPNAQVCRRLAGASLECRPPPPVSRSGWVPPYLSGPPDVYTQPPKGPTARLVVHHYHRQLRHASASADARSTLCVCVRVCMCACVRMRAPRRRYVTSSHGNQCSWPPTRSHGAEPTRPASFGHLCTPLTCPLSLFLFFLIFLPLLFSAILLFVSLPARTSVSSFSSPSPSSPSSFFSHTSVFIYSYFTWRLSRARERYFNIFGI